MCIYSHKKILYTTVQKFRASKFFNVDHQNMLTLFDQKHNKNSNILKYYCNSK